MCRRNASYSLSRCATFAAGPHRLLLTAATNTPYWVVSEREASILRDWVRDGLPLVADEVMESNHISESPAGIVAENEALHTPSSLGGTMFAYV